MDDTAKAIRQETDKPSLPSRLGLAPRGREDPPLHAPTHHCPTLRMSGEDPHSLRGAQSSAGPHEVGWEERQQVGFKIKFKKTQMHLLGAPSRLARRKHRVSDGKDILG